MDVLTLKSGMDSHANVSQTIKDMMESTVTRSVKTHGGQIPTRPVSVTGDSLSMEIPAIKKVKFLLQFQLRLPLPPQ